MLRRSAIPLLLILALGCASAPNNNGPLPSVSNPLEVTSPSTAAEAAVVYKAIADQYAVLRAGAVQLRANHSLTDDQWVQVVHIEQAITAADPTIAALISAWNASGSKPQGFDAQLAQWHSSVYALGSVAAPH